jgi:hypothetical protein
MLKPTTASVSYCVLIQKITLNLKSRNVQPAVEIKIIKVAAFSVKKPLSLLGGGKRSASILAVEMRMAEARIFESLVTN